MSMRCNTYPALSIRFLLEIHRFIIKQFTRYIANIYGSTFVITHVQMKKLPTLYVIFFPIQLKISWWKLPTSYVRNTTSDYLLMQIINNQWMIHSEYYMLAHPVLHKISIDTYKWVRYGRNIQHSMSYYHWENTALRYKDLQRILLAFL